MGGMRQSQFELRGPTGAEVEREQVAKSEKSDKAIEISKIIFRIDVSRAKLRLLFLPEQLMLIISVSRR